MRFHKYSQLAVVGILLSIISCNTSTDRSADEKKSAKMMISEESVTYNATGDTVTMNGFIAYDSSSEKKRPVVIVVHEWWGLNEYTKMRAKQLAELGYLAIAIDLYGNGRTGPDPESAGKLAMPFYQHPDMAKRRFDAALKKINTYSIADTNNMVAIGYCFGGAQVLNMARLGVPLKGVVSFHGNLAGVPADKNLIKADVLICHGEADQFVPAAEVMKFKKEMDSIGAPYTFKSYPGATHAFTNPEATENGKKFNIPIAYNAAADSASWNDMKIFFGKIFK